MPDSKLLPHIIRLLDDDSPIVREAVKEQLGAFGQTLTEELSRLKIALTPEQRRAMSAMLAEHSRSWLLNAWRECLAIPDESRKLEQAMSLIVQFQFGREYPYTVSDVLDRLAGEFKKASRKRDVLSLANFLFKTKQLRGVESDFFNPLNSNLIYVVQERRGIPITLASIYMLVGHRLQLDIGGINFPGRFLARVTHGRNQYIVDCSDGGRFLADGDLINLRNGSAIPLLELFQLECDTMTMLVRVTRNLLNAYHHAQDPSSVQLMKELLQMIESQDQGDE